MLSHWYSTTKTTGKRPSLSTTPTAPKSISINSVTALAASTDSIDKTITTRRTSFITKRILHLPPTTSPQNQIRQKSSFSSSIGQFSPYQQQQQQRLAVPFYPSLYTHSLNLSTASHPLFYRLAITQMRQYHHLKQETSSQKQPNHGSKKSSSSPTTLLKKSKGKGSFLFLLTTAVFVSTPLLAYFTLFGNGAAADVDTPTKEEIIVEEEEGEKKCPIYGCSLLPKDVYYDKSTRFYLSLLRQGGGGATTKEEKEEKEEEKKSEDEAVAAAPEQEKKEALESLKHVGTNTEATLTLIGYKGGKMENQINQDRAFVISPFMLGEEKKEGKLLGVFDGHAKLGELVSQHVVSQLPNILSNKLQSTDVKEEEIKKALHESFVELDTSAPADKSGGCTASVVLHMSHDDDNVYIANAGDSRSFIVSYVKPLQKVTIEYATREDKPHLEDERKRVESMGGRVYIPPEGNGGTSRVMYLDSRGNQFGLAMSRSIGDWEAGKLGVIPDPIVDVVKISDIVSAHVKDSELSCVDGGKYAVVGEDGTVTVEQQTCAKVTKDDVEIFAVSATDGLLDYVSLDAIATHVAKGLYESSSSLQDPEEEKKEGEKLHLLNACEDLILTAAKGWHDHKGGRYRDDIAIAVSVVSSPSSFKRSDE